MFDSVTEFSRRRWHIHGLLWKRRTSVKANNNKNQSSVSPGLCVESIDDQWISFKNGQ